MEGFADLEEHFHVLEDGCLGGTGTVNAHGLPVDVMGWE